MTADGLHDRIGRAVPVVATALVGISHLVAYAALAARPATGAADAILDGWLPALPVLAQAAVLPARRRAPLLTLGVVAGLDVLVLAMSSGELGTGAPGVMFAAYAAARARDRPGRYRVVLLVALLATVAEGVALQSSTEIATPLTIPYALLRGILVFGTPVLVAEIVTGRERLVEALRERAEAAERERELRASEAVQRERSLMARELHDIAGHHLSGIVVSAQAADALLRSEPDRASEYLGVVKREGQATLANLRQVVGLLRSDERGELAPVATVDQLPALVASASATGSPVAFTTTGDPVELGPLAAAAAYRMVQESLANTSLHAAGAPREVRVDYGRGSVVLTVRNAPGRGAIPPHPPRDGYGLIGMAERAVLVGATLVTGPAPDGGWTNTLTLPYGENPA